VKSFIFVGHYFFWILFNQRNIELKCQLKQVSADIYVCVHWGP